MSAPCIVCGKYPKASYSVKMARVAVDGPVASGLLQTDKGLEMYVMTGNAHVGTNEAIRKERDHVLSLATSQMKGTVERRLETFHDVRVQRPDLQVFMPSSSIQSPFGW